jgi:hypothetical protein
MKLLIAFSLSAVWLAAADQAAPQASQPLSVPPGAVAVAPRAFLVTDADGKRWIYHTSPFGVSREPEGAPQRFHRDYATIKAVEDGETVRFERPTPFGTLRWQARKSELNEIERMVWEREQAARRTSSPAQE